MVWARLPAVPLPDAGTYTAGTVRGRLGCARGRRDAAHARVRRPGPGALAGRRRRPRAAQPLCRAAPGRRARAGAPLTLAASLFLVTDNMSCVHFTMTIVMGVEVID